MRNSPGAAHQQEPAVVPLVPFVAVGTGGAQAAHHLVDRHAVPHRRHDVEDRLGGNAGNGRAPGVHHVDRQIAEQGADRRALLRPERRPVRVVRARAGPRTSPARGRVRPVAPPRSRSSAVSTPLLANVANGSSPKPGHDPEAATIGPLRCVPDMSPSLGASPKGDTLPSAVTTQ